jgi:hypothetical protein
MGGRLLATLPAMVLGILGLVRVEAHAGLALRCLS